MNKECKTCRATKDLSEFGVCRSHGKQYVKTVCKECFKNTKCVSCGRPSSGKRKCDKCYRGDDKRERSRVAHVYSVEAWLRSCLTATKQCSPARKARGYRVKENDLTIEFLLDLWHRQSGRCYVSGIELKTQSTNICSASIDRINPEIGYLKTNVALTCQWVNLGRNRCPMDKFRDILIGLRETITPSG